MHAVQTWWATPAFAAPALALGVAVAIVVLGKRWPKLPVSLVAIVAATIAARVAGLDVTTIGSLPSPLALPSLPDVAVGDFGALLGPAVAVAALAALESLLSATVADGMTVGQRHDPDRELFGQGMANVVTPLFGGIPATAAIARTAVNVRTGGRSRLAAMTQSVALLVVALAAAGLVSSIPLAALAGVLFATTLQMVEFSSVRSLLRASRSDGAVLLITVAATIVLNLVMAVLVGLGLAMVFALRGMARMAEISAVPLDPTDHTAAERSLLDQHVIAYRLEGPLFFGAAHTFLLELAELGDVRVVILRMARIHALDSSGAAVLADTITGLERHGVTVLLSGLRPEHERMLEQLGVLDRLRHENHVFATTPPAIDHALRHVQGHSPPAPAAVTA